MATSGEDSLLVYTYENVLLHYVFVSSAKTVKLAQVGQIAFHGIIRAPPRVRAISWILPEEQRGMYFTPNSFTGYLHNQITAIPHMMLLQLLYYS